MARIASLVYAYASTLVELDTYDRPPVALAVLVVMTVWTVVVSLLLARPRRHPAGLLVADLAVAATALMTGVVAQGREAIDAGSPSITVTLGAIPVVAWAVHDGARGGALAAAVMSAATVAWRGAVTRPTVGSCVLLLLLGTVVGYVVQLARRAETAYAEVVQREAAQAEREIGRAHV